MGDFFIFLPSIVMSPLIFQNEGIDNLFHGIIGDKLILGQFSSSNGVKMSNPLQMLFNILSIIRNSWWGNDRLLENLKTDFELSSIFPWKFKFRFETFTILQFLPMGPVFLWWSGAVFSWITIAVNLLYVVKFVLQFLI